MSKCDLCGEQHPSHSLVSLREFYQTSGVQDVCPKCETWANEQLDRLRAEIAPQMRDLIHLKANRPPTLWQRIKFLPARPTTLKETK